MDGAGSAPRRGGRRGALGSGRLAGSADHGGVEGFGCQVASEEQQGADLDADGVGGRTGDYLDGGGVERHAGVDRTAGGHRGAGGHGAGQADAGDKLELAACAGPAPKATSTAVVVVVVVVVVAAAAPPASRNRASRWITVDTLLW
jgi:hypothetical protein